jgi:phage gp46-like protein
MDIALSAIAALTDDFAFDITLTGPDLTPEQGMTTAVIISLFTDARAADDDVLPNPGGDRRGWWGDTYAAIPGDVQGSKLWLLDRGKQTPDVLVSAKQYAEAALQWLVDDGVAAGVVATASFTQTGWWALNVVITRPDGQARLNYDFVWANS